jgi:glycosyltransferase involved in cell wall biosynthesis
MNGTARASLRIGVEMISAGTGFQPSAGGMISYYDGLLTALCARADVDSLVVFVAPANGSLAVPDDPKIEVVRCRGLLPGRPARVAYEQLVLGLLARRSRIDVLLCTTNIVPLLRRAPTVVVLQSIQHFLWPEETGRLRRAYLRFFTPRSLRRAGAVIAVTETERTDALALFDVDADRIVSVHHGVSNWTKAALARGEPPIPHQLPGGVPYVLMVSRLYDFKNHRRLIEAFARLNADPGFRHHLLIAGGDADVTREDLGAHAESHGVGERVHLLGPVPQADIPGLFEGADAIAYVSLYETFGHPVLEAFAFGKPLITSRTSATAEVAGDAAQLVDPESVTSIAEGLRSVLTDGALRDRLAAAGPRRAATFTWDRCAEGTMGAIGIALARHAVADSRPGRLRP